MRFTMQGIESAPAKQYRYLDVWMEIEGGDWQWQWQWQ